MTNPSQTTAGGTERDWPTHWPKPRKIAQGLSDATSRVYELGGGNTGHVMHGLRSVGQFVMDNYHPLHKALLAADALLASPPVAGPAVVEWLRREAGYARHAQDVAKNTNDKLYRMGQKDALLLAAEAIERGQEIVSVGPADQEQSCGDSTDTRAPAGRPISGSSDGGPSPSASTSASGTSTSSCTSRSGSSEPGARQDGRVEMAKMNRSVDELLAAFRFAIENGSVHSLLIGDHELARIIVEIDDLRAAASSPVERQGADQGGGVDGCHDLRCRRPNCDCPADITERQLDALTRERDRLAEKALCPLGITTRQLCSAGSCPECLADHLIFHRSRAEAAEAERDRLRDENARWSEEANHAAFDLAEARRRHVSASEGEPIAWIFELAMNYGTADGEYSCWGSPQVSLTKPCVPEGAVRNLRPLFASVSEPERYEWQIACESLGDELQRVSDQLADTQRQLEAMRASRLEECEDLRRQLREAREALKRIVHIVGGARNRASAALTAHDIARSVSTPPTRRRPGMAGEDHIEADGEWIDCWQCGGEGLLPNCWEEFACIDPEGGCDDCLERCDICRGKGGWLQPYNSTPDAGEDKEGSDGA